MCSSWAALSVDQTRFIRLPFLLCSGGGGSGCCCCCYLLPLARAFRRPTNGRFTTRPEKSCWTMWFDLERRRRQDQQASRQGVDVCSPQPSPTARRLKYLQFLFLFRLYASAFYIPLGQLRSSLILFASCILDSSTITAAAFEAPYP